MAQSSNTPFQAQWEEDKVFEEKNVSVVVWKSDHHIPRYRIESAFNFGGKRHRSLSIFANGEEVTTENPAELIADLFDDAYEYVEEEIAKFQKEREARRR